MNGYYFYKLCVAMRLHFTTDKYDIFEKRGAINCSYESFLSKSNKGVYEFIGSKFPSPQEATRYIVACFVYDVNLYDYHDGVEAMARWNKEREMTTQLILDDLDTLQLPFCLHGDPCELQRLVSGSQIHVQTAVALNRVYKFAEHWKNNFVYAKLGRKIEKLDKFVKFNEMKVNNVIKQHEIAEV